jgi:hypothetical protein
MAISCATKASSPPWILDPVFPRTAASSLVLGPIVHHRERGGGSASACPVPDQRVEWARLDSMSQQQDAYEAILERPDHSKVRKVRRSVGVGKSLLGHFRGEALRSTSEVQTFNPEAMR